jgi:hypothetical protein
MPGRTAAGSADGDGGGKGGSPRRGEPRQRAASESDATITDGPRASGARADHPTVALPGGASRAAWEGGTDAGRPAADVWTGTGRSIDGEGTGAGCSKPRSFGELGTPRSEGCREPVAIIRPAPMSAAPTAAALTTAAGLLSEAAAAASTPIPAAKVAEAGFE